MRIRRRDQASDGLWIAVAAAGKAREVFRDVQAVEQAAEIGRGELAAGHRHCGVPRWTEERILAFLHDSDRDSGSRRRKGNWRGVPADGRGVTRGRH